jgi:hypothetical protein
MSPSVLASTQVFAAASYGRRQVADALQRSASTHSETDAHAPGSGERRKSRGNRREAGRES